MKNQAIFSSKDKNKKIKMLSAAILFSTLRVKTEQFGVSLLIDADGMANTVDPDQTAGSGSALFAQTFMYLSRYLNFYDIQFVEALLRAHLSQQVIKYHMYFKSGLLLSTIFNKFKIFILFQVWLCIYQGGVVQSIISLTSSLRGQLVKCFTTL